MAVLLIVLIFVAAAVVFQKLVARNAHRLGSVVRVTRGHAIATLVMAVISPVGVYGIVPILPLMVVGDPDFSAIGGLVWVLAYGFVWYFPASLVVSGVRDKALRVLVLFLFWMALVSLIFVAGQRRDGDLFLFPGI